MATTNEDVLKGQRTVGFDDGSAFQLETRGTPMVDTGVGRPLILRTFEFSIKPGVPIPSRQDVFDSHWPQIRAIIWSDGLVANTDVDPRVVIGKKRYRIFILCEPKFRTMVVDRPKTLQDLFNKKK